MNAQPRLVIDRDTGLVCVQLCMGQHSATLPLPKHLKTTDRLGVEAFMSMVVPEMMRGLSERRRQEIKKTMKRKDQSESIAQTDGESPGQELSYDTSECDPGPDAGAEASADGCQGVP